MQCLSGFELYSRWVPPWIALSTARINHYPVDNATGFRTTYPLDSDLSGGYCYPIFEQPGPGG